MSEVFLKSFKNKSGKEISYLEIVNGSKYPTSIGIKKAKAILDSQEPIKAILVQAGL